MTSENKSKRFQNWPKATLSTSTPKQAIESKGHNQREQNNDNNDSRKNKNVFTTLGYRWKSDLLITQPGTLD